MPRGTANNAIKKGFTLIELIVVIVILGLLATLAVPTFGSVLQNTKNEISYSELEAAARNTKALHLIQSKGAWEEETVVAALSESNVSALSEGVFAADDVKHIPQRLTGNEAPNSGVIGYLIDNEGDLRLVKLTTDKRAAVVTLDSISGGAQLEAKKSSPAVPVNDGVLDLPAAEPETPGTPETPETPVEEVTLSQPADLTFTNNTATSKGTLVWTAVANATSYEVSVNGGAPVVTNTSSIEVDTTPGQEITFSVSALAGEVRSTPSEHTVRVEAAIPQNLTSNLVYASKWSPGALTLNWDEVPGATSYNVYRGATLLSQVPTNSYSGSHNLKAVSSVTVKAVTAAGESPASEPTKLTYLNTNAWTTQFPSDGVTNINVPLGLTLSASNTRTYELYRNGETTPVLTASGNATPNYTDSTLAPDTEHTFRVVIKDGNSRAESVATFFTPPKAQQVKVVGSPTMIFSGEVAANVELSWPAAPYVNYKLYSSKDGKFGADTVEVGNGFLTMKAENLEASVSMPEGSQLYYRLIGTNIRTGLTSVTSPSMDTLVKVLPFGSSNSPTTSLKVEKPWPNVTAATLTWTGNVGLDQVVQRKLSTSNTWETLHTVPGDPQSNSNNRYYSQDFVDYSIVVNGITKTYDYRVLTRGDAGDHVMSASLTVK